MASDDVRQQMQIGIEHFAGNPYARRGFMYRLLGGVSIRQRGRAIAVVGLRERGNP